MRSGVSYNRQRAAKARELAGLTSLVEHRQNYLRLAFQYDAITDLEASQNLVRFSPSHLAREPKLWQSLAHDRACSHPTL